MITIENKTIIKGANMKNNRKYSDDIGWNIIGWIAERVFPYLLLAVIGIFSLLIIGMAIKLILILIH
jgi:hypothetical protein